MDLYVSFSSARQKIEWTGIELRFCGYQEIAELRGILNDSNEDDEMKNVAKEELEGQVQELDRFKDDLIDQLLPRDEADDSGCILEVRAGKIRALNCESLFSLRLYSCLSSFTFEFVPINFEECKPHITSSPRSYQFWSLSLGVEDSL